MKLNKMDWEKRRTIEEVRHGYDLSSKQRRILYGILDHTQTIEAIWFYCYRDVERFPVPYREKSENGSYTDFLLKNGKVISVESQDGLFGRSGNEESFENWYRVSIFDIDGSFGTIGEGSLPRFESFSLNEAIELQDKLISTVLGAMEESLDRKTSKFPVLNKLNVWMDGDEGEKKKKIKKLIRKNCYVNKPCVMELR